MTMRLRDTKLAHMRFLKRMMKKTTDTESLTYLKMCAQTLDKEITNEEEDDLVQYNQIIYEKIKQLGFDDFKSKILAILFENDCAKTSDISKACDEDRGKTYRHLEELRDMGIIERTNGKIVHFFIMDRTNPFGNMIEIKQKEVDLYKSFSAIPKIVN